MSHLSKEAFSTPRFLVLLFCLLCSGSQQTPWSFPEAEFAKVTLGAQTSTHVWTFATDDEGGIQLLYENSLQREMEKIVAPK